MPSNRHNSRTLRPEGPFPATTAPAGDDCTAASRACFPQTPGSHDGDAAAHSGWRPEMGFVIDLRRVLDCSRRDLNRFAVGTCHPMADFLHRTVLTLARRGEDYSYRTQAELAIQASLQDGSSNFALAQVRQVVVRHVLTSCFRDLTILHGRVLLRGLPAVQPESVNVAPVAANSPTPPLAITTAVTPAQLE